MQKRGITLDNNDKLVEVLSSKKDDNGLPNKIIERLKEKRYTILELSNYFDVSPNRIKSIINEFIEKRLTLDIVDDTYLVLPQPKKHEEPIKINNKKYKEKEIAFGAIADTHIGSLYERLDVLNALYDRFEDYGITTVYHGGNFIDGECRFNKGDIYVHGADRQIKNFVEKYPQRKGIITYFIAGDDHEGWYVQREKVNIGQITQDEAERQGRKDLVYIGYMERDIELHQTKGYSTIRIIHGGGGSAYAHSYSSQKYTESLQGGDKPQIVLIGHFHKFEWCYPREVHAIQLGTTQDQSPFLRKKRIQAMVGGCVVWIKQNELGIFTSVKVEWIPFYDLKFYAYKW